MSSCQELVLTEVPRAGSRPPRQPVVTGGKSFGRTWPGEASEIMSILGPHPRPGRSEPAGPGPAKESTCVRALERPKLPQGSSLHKDIWVLLLGILTQWVWAGASESAFLISSQVLMMQVTQESHFEIHISCSSNA